MFALFNAFKTLGMSLILILGAVITTQGDFAWFYSAMGALWVLGQVVFLVTFDFSKKTVSDQAKII